MDSISLTSCSNVVSLAVGRFLSVFNATSTFLNLLASFLELGSLDRYSLGVFSQRAELGAIIHDVQPHIKQISKVSVVQLTENVMCCLEANLVEIIGA